MTNKEVGADYDYWMERARAAARRGQVSAARQHLNRAKKYGCVGYLLETEVITLAERNAKAIEKENRFSFGGA